MAKGNHSATGRPPSADPKKNYITIKMTDGEKEELEETAHLLQMKKSRVLVEGMHRMTEKARAEAWQRTKGEFSTPKQPDPDDDLSDIFG